jgi:hypothetical protein
MIARPTLALDIATACGWAAYLDGRVASGTLHLPTVDYGQMSADFSRWVADRFFDGVQVLVLERPTAFRITDSYTRCTGLCWDAHRVAWVHEIERHELRPSEWRKALFGKGNLSTTAAKDWAMAWCREQGFSPAGHDEAEALCILHVGMTQWP